MSPIDDFNVEENIQNEYHEFIESSNIQIHLSFPEPSE
jgi:hypothetical protein